MTVNASLPVAQVEKPARAHERRYSSLSPVPHVRVWEPLDQTPEQSAAMTVSQPQGHQGHQDQQASAILLAKRWGPERVVSVRREHDSSLGISIVGGKVSGARRAPRDEVASIPPHLS